MGVLRQSDPISSSMNRRHLLDLLGACAVSISGCLGSGMPADAVVRAVPDSQSNTDVTVQYSALPEREQAIVRTAVEDAFYHAGPEPPDAVRSLGNRLEEPDTAYLTYQNTTYALWIRITDIVLAATASSPERGPSSGLI